jgi:hypothetical protein
LADALKKLLNRFLMLVYWSGNITAPLNELIFLFYHRRDRIKVPQRERMINGQAQGLFFLGRFHHEY